MIFSSRNRRSGENAVRFRDVKIPYHLRRSKRARRLRLVVTPGKVEVVVPRRITLATARAFAHSRRQWIYEKTEALRERALAVYPPRFVSGAKVLYRGRYLRLRVESVAVARASLRYVGGFHVQLPVELTDEEREAVTRRLVTSWIAGRALEDARSLVRRYAPRLGAAPAGLRIGNQKTLWGSCSPRGVLSLNAKLMAAPKAVFEYVVVHELCHLLERNHGPQFWSLVAELLPDYRERRAWLKKHGVALG